MVRHSSKGGIPAGNPIANILVVIAGVLAIAASVVLGFFAFVALSAIILVTAAIIGIRVWWLNRKLGRQAPKADATTRRPASGGVIEGEYHVVRGDEDQA